MQPLTRPRANHRRTKSLPSVLKENAYTGKPLFWFCRGTARRSTNGTRKTIPTTGSLTTSTTSSTTSNFSSRSIVRLLGNFMPPYQCMSEEYNQSFDTAESTTEAEDEEYQYSDDEASLKGLSLLEE